MKKSLKEELVLLLNSKPEDKSLFYRSSKKWHGFIFSPHKEVRLILLKMILELCDYNECVINVINNQDSQPNIDCMFFLSAITLQQKRLDELNTSDKKRM
jgi:hypothetical protein